MERVLVIRPFVGPLYDDEILKVCNTQNPSGTKGGWSYVVQFGKAVCQEYPDRIHALVGR